MQPLNPTLDYFALGLTALMVVVGLLVSFWLDRTHATSSSSTTTPASAPDERAR